MVKSCTSFLQGLPEANQASRTSSDALSKAAPRRASTSAGAASKFSGPSPYEKRPDRIYDSSLLSDERRCASRPLP